MTNSQRSLRRLTSLVGFLVPLFVLAGCDDGSQSACLQGGCPTSTTVSVTLPSDTSSFDVYLAVTNDAGLLGALQFDARFLGGTGDWVGAAGSVRCAALIDMSLSTFNDKGGGLLSAALINLNGLPTPGELLRCTFGTDEPLTPDSFEVDVVDAAGVDGSRPSTLPVMGVTRIEPIP